MSATARPGHELIVLENRLDYIDIIEAPTACAWFITNDDIAGFQIEIVGVRSSPLRTCFRGEQAGRLPE